MDNTHLTNMIVEIIDVHTYLRKQDDGIYYTELYADYRNEFCQQIIKELFSNGNPRDKFTDLISESWDDARLIEENVITNMIREHLSEFNEGISDEQDNFISDWVCNNVIIQYPYEHYLQQDVCINIYVDTGDGNYDFTQNQLFGFYADPDSFDGHGVSSLVWLMKQQGYTTEQIVSLVKHENTHGSKLLESIKQECENTSSSMNTLSFFVKMTLKEAFDLHELLSKGLTDTKHEDAKQHNAKAAAEPEAIIIKRETHCGLYDPWNGAGGILDIDLEHDVKLPIKFIDSALPDGCRGQYGARNTYGLCSSFWSENTIKVAA